MVILILILDKKNIKIYWKQNSFPLLCPRQWKEAVDKEKKKNENENRKGKKKKRRTKHRENEGVSNGKKKMKNKKIMGEKSLWFLKEKIYF